MHGLEPGIPRCEGKPAAYDLLGPANSSMWVGSEPHRCPAPLGLRAGASRWGGLRKETTPRAQSGLGDAPPRPGSQPFCPVNSTLSL